MDVISELNDDEFVPFLKKLDVETYGKSFEWMLNDPEISRVLKWMFRNLDQNNALTSHEEYRYLELQKEGKLLSSNELETEISNIHGEYEDIPVPGDEDGIEYLKLQISLQDEKLKYLHKHKDNLGDLITKTKKRNEELNHELSRLNAQENQSKEDEEITAEKCLSLAKEVENITEDVVTIIAKAINIYENSHLDKGIAQNFLAFGPFEAYLQSQRLFKSHFYLFTSKKFSNKEVNAVTEKEARQHLQEARSIGTNISTVENRAAIELLEQESSILERQIEDMTKNYVNKRTNIVAEGTLRSALLHREGQYKDLCWLHDMVYIALCLDSLLYYATRYELQLVEDLVQFAKDLKDYILEEEHAVASRIEQMKHICAEHAICEKRLETNNPLLHALCLLYEVDSNNGVEALIAKANKVQKEKLELKENIYRGFQEKENMLIKFEPPESKCTLPFVDNCNPKRINLCIPDLLGRNRISDGGEHGQNSDKYGLRKLWQWFLTDPSKLMVKLKEAGALV
ncbi:hypothetical protein EVAR_20657_1 [Eumeta japonica]|uniref:HAUS augmin-like complex subunit 3 N-terminal domain-containing protein n=1 Tax=Eumeta variegata TaxID=151549 RepID=A0A4C1VAH7_EUMVA|nr:hypothetical protein EVAR_20657_1 [Eumeta japonica]